MDDIVASTIGRVGKLLDGVICDEIEAAPLASTCFHLLRNATVSGRRASDIDTGAFRATSAGSRLACAQQARRHAWELLHSGDWRSVPKVVRGLYMSASAIEAAHELDGAVTALASAAIHLDGEQQQPSNEAGASVAATTAPPSSSASLLEASRTLVSSSLRCLDLALMLGLPEGHPERGIVMDLTGVAEGLRVQVEAMAMPMMMMTAAAAPAVPLPQGQEVSPNACANAATGSSELAAGTRPALAPSNVKPATTSTSSHSNIAPLPPAPPTVSPPKPLPPHIQAIPTIHVPSMSAFYTSFMLPRRPVVIDGAMEDWPAMGRRSSCSSGGCRSGGSVSGSNMYSFASQAVASGARALDATSNCSSNATAATACACSCACSSRAWSNMSYLLSVCGHRTVPVELGRHYMDEGWGQGLMNVRDFIRTHILGQGDDDGDTSGSSSNGERSGDHPPLSHSQHLPQPEPRQPHIHAQRPPIGYLAQHPLFDHIPQLRDDIRIPDYCALTDTDEAADDIDVPSTEECDEHDGQGLVASGDGDRASKRPKHMHERAPDASSNVEANAGASTTVSARSDPPHAEPRIHAWFGPGGTVSCLHYDAPHNLLCQVVGRKRVRLYPPDEDTSARLYPHPGLMSNTAQVDPEVHDVGTDVDAAGDAASHRSGKADAAAAVLRKHNPFPLFQGTPGYECVIGPGQMLYIPPRWWHHVRSLSTSFSVSFWWGWPSGLSS